MLFDRQPFTLCRFGQISVEELSDELKRIIRATLHDLI